MSQARNVVNVARICSQQFVLAKSFQDQLSWIVIVEIPTEILGIYLLL